jgi:hypothetical protein
MAATPAMGPLDFTALRRRDLALPLLFVNRNSKIIPRPLDIAACFEVTTSGMLARPLAGARSSDPQSSIFLRR